MNKKFAYTFDAGERLQEVLNQKDIGITDLHKRTGIARNTLYSFIYNGCDISSARLAVICRHVGVSMDYIMGLKK